MSKLLKSKILLGVFVFALAVSFSAVALGADGPITKTLKYGMKDVQVKYLQQTLNETGFTVAAAGRAGSAGFETSFFGNATKAAVKAYQAAMGLVSDGIFGPASRGALGGSVTSLPAGCTSTAGFSATTGVACNSGTTTTTTYPAGCTSTVGYSPTTGVKCDSTVVVTPPVVTGPVAVALASDNPAARSVVLLEAGADLAHFAFSGTGTVTNLTLKRIGISADASLLNVYLYDGANRLTDAASVSSNSVITFNDPNGLFTVSGTKTISVKSDMNAASGETIGVSLTGYTALSQTAVVLSSPISGNLMSAASATLAGVSFGTVTPAANSSLTPEKDITVWQSQASVTTRDVKLSHFTIREVGGIAKTDLQNLRLYVDGVVVGTVANPDANGYSTFVPASPLTLKTGSHTIKVVADVMGGSSLSFTFSIRNKTDIGLIDSQYGVGLLTSTAVGSLTGFLQTVATGYITVEKATDSPSSTVVLAGTDVLLAKFKATTYGEKVKVDGLTVDYTTGSVNTLRNGRVLVNGAQVGSTTNIDPLGDATATDAGTVYNINYTFEPGVSYIEVRGDVYAATGTAFANADTILVNLYGAGTLNNAQGLVSGDATLDVPGANVNGNTLTVGSGSMTLAKDQSYGNQSVVVPTTGTLLGSWTLTSGTNEALNLDTIQVDLTFADEFAAADLSNVYVTYGSKTTSTKATVSATAAANTWSISESMAANSSLSFKVYGNIATGAVVTTTAADTVIPSLLVSGTSTSGTAVNTNSNAVLAGQTITAVNSGTLSVYLDANTPVAAQVVAGSTDAAGSLKLKLSATNEDTYVKSVKVYVDTNSNSLGVSSMNLAYATTSNGTYTTVGTDQSVSYTVSTYPGYSTWTLTGSGRVTVPKNGSVYLKVTPTYVSSGQTAVTGKTPKLFLGDIQAEGTSVLAASGTTGTLVNSTGILVYANSTAAAGRTYIDSTENKTAVALTATATTFATANGQTFLPGDVIFVDHSGDELWTVASEELMVVLADAGANFTVQRGAFGTTASAADATGTDSIFRLNTATMATNGGIVGNAMTILNTKLGLALSASSPSGATSAGTAKIVFAFTASAANNSADTATNTATITYVDVTATESGTTTLTDLKLYPSEYDTNTSYATTCGALTASKWRCTLSTTGNTNQIDENSSRTYILRGNTAYAANGSIDISIAALGTSSDSANSVYWTDGTTPQYWVNQASTYVQSASPLSSAVASGTADVTAPTITSVVFGGTADNALAVADTVVVTFSEVIDPTTIKSTLVPGGAAVTIVDGETGDMVVAVTTGILTVTNIFTTDIDAGDPGAATYTNTATLDSTGKILTLTITVLGSGTAALAGAETFADVAAVTTTVKDVSAVTLADSTVTPTGDI